ncbi:MAG: prolyl aminopeptidase [bacterium]
MRKYLWLALAFLFTFIGLTALSQNSDSKEEIELWPEIEPFQTDYLEVSDIHEIYYELCGSPDGRPVFVLHGGPGSGCSPYYRRFLDPERFLIVLHDQRGAKRSQPYAEIRQNTTQDLVGDIEKLREHLNLKKIVLFGGSWGTTLGLAYAETYPENVSGMVLRGVFTATKEEIDHFYHGGVRTFFPEVYDRLLGPLQESDRRPLPQILLELVQSEDPVVREKYSKIWTRYEFKIGALETSDEFIDEYLQGEDVMDRIYSFALLENYYMANDCFLEEGQLLRDADKIRDIPVIIVNGRYDMVCPPITAYRLHQKLPKSKLIIVEGAGHWMGDEPIERALLKAMREFE